MLLVFNKQVKTFSGRTILVIQGERSANRPKQLRNDAFHVKTSQSAKNMKVG